jgi:rhamnogalacturonyl hydrolase YesR
MNKKQRILYWEAVIKAIIADHKALDKACLKAIEAGAMDANGQLFTAIWKAFDGLLGHLDQSDWLSWFIYDNDCGKAGREAKVGTHMKLKPIRTPRQLAELITKYEKQNHGR